MNFTLLWNVFILSKGETGWVIYTANGDFTKQETLEDFFCFCFFLQCLFKTQFMGSVALSQKCSCPISFLPFIMWCCQFSWPRWVLLGLLFYCGSLNLLFATVILPHSAFPTQPSNFAHPFVWSWKLFANCLIAPLEPRESDRTRKWRCDFGPGQQKAMLSLETR